MPDEIGRLYPDVVTHGSLGMLLRSELARQGASVQVQGFDELIGGSVYWAEVRTHRRSSQITLAVQDRCFISDFWENRVELASLVTASVSLVARALNSWHGAQIIATELKARHAEIQLSGRVGPYEAGPEGYVDAAWQALHTGTAEDYRELLPLVVEAMTNDKLRRLLPFTSHTTLCFSRGTGYPFSADCPRITPLAEAHFQVTDSSGTALGEGDAKESVTLAVRHLPVNVGPAVHGTAEGKGIG